MRSAVPGRGGYEAGTSEFLLVEGERELGVRGQRSVVHVYRIVYLLHAVNERAALYGALADIFLHPRVGSGYARLHGQC